ncbi:hypothetical protein [Chondromyces apiculatus]|nr:hypothetical protein [Chondromyces apiculatus]
MTRLALLLTSLTAAFAIPATTSIGCTGTIGGATGEGAGSGAGTGVGGNGGAGGGISEEGLREMFETTVEPKMLVCDACHMEGGSSGYEFMKKPVYDTVKSKGGLVIKDYEKSRFLTHSVSTGPHTGTNIDTIDGLPEAMTAWLKAEADAMEEPVPNPEIPLVGPFDVRTSGALSSVRFDPYLGASYEGISIVFQASLSGDALTLANVRVHGTQELGVQWKGVKVQTFAGDTGTNIPGGLHDNFAVTVLPGEAKDFDPANVVINGYEEGTKIGFFFTDILPLDGASGATDCADLTTFTTGAQGPIQMNCATAACHGNSNTSAGDVMDLSDLAADAAAGCRVIRARLLLSDPPNSQIFINSDPAAQGATHPFKFNGDAAAFDAFRTAVLPWVQAEAAAPAP